MSDDVLALISGKQTEAIEKPKGGGVNTMNVGNIRPVGGTGFVQPQSFEEGIKGIDENLKVYGSKHGINTLRGVISRWAPPSDNNDTETYIKNVSQKTGIKPDEKIDLSNPVIRHILSGPIILQEKGLKNLLQNQQQGQQPTQQQGQQPNDDVSSLILGSAPTAQPKKTQPVERPQETGAAFGNPTLTRQGEKAREAGGGNLQSIVGGITDALKTMSIPDWQKESILANMLKYGVGQMPIVGDQGFHEEGKNKLIETGKSAVNAVMNPKETYEAISQQEPGALLGQMVKGGLYDAALGPSAKPIVNAASVVAKPVISATGQVIKPVATSIEGAVKPVKEALGEAFAEIKKNKSVENKALEQKSTLSGAGAAEVGKENLRIAKAKELPIPIELSKDQATRSPADVRFARETAKDPVLGQPLQEKYASDNAKIQQNLNQFIQDTGAEFSEAGTPKLGEMLVNTVEPYKNARYGEIEPAYNLAKEAGHMSEPLEINPLQQFVEKNVSASKNAPIINAIENEIIRLSKDGKITINDLEEVRKMVNVLRQDVGPNSHYGKKAIKIIDKMTENKGGELYQKARKLNTDYMTEFEDTPVLKNIFSTKRGTTQRATAIEDLVEKSLLKGPKDDVVKLFSTLEKSGPEGVTMINELRGYVAQKIKDEATKGVALDINGLPYVSTKNLDTIIKNLDKSGKLDYIFGKKGAEHYRTLNDVTKDLQTIPQNVTNPSGTAATLLGALTEMGIQGATTGIPIPIAMIGKHLYKSHKTKQNLNKISDFVNYSKENK